MVALLSFPLGPAAGAGLEPVVGAEALAAERDVTTPPSDSATVTTSPSVASPADSVPSRTIAVAPPPRARRTLPETGRFDRPRWVMLRSLLVPGWGQAHNGAWLKAALVVAGDGALRVRFFRDERRLGDLNGKAVVGLADLGSADLTLAAAQAELTAAQASGDSARIAAAEAALLAANLARTGASDTYNSAVIAYNALLETSINRRWLLGGVVVYALIDAYVDAHFKSFDINFQFDPALPGGTGVPGARLQIRWAF